MHLLPSSLHSHTRTLSEPAHLLLESAGHDDQTVEMRRRPGFHDQRCFYHGYGVWMLATDAFHPLVLITHNCRMHKRVEFLDAAFERQFRESRAAYGAVCIQYPASEVLDNGGIDGLPGGHQRVRDLVRANDVGTPTFKHRCDRRLAASNSAGQTYLEHAIPRIPLLTHIVHARATLANGRMRLYWPECKIARMIPKDLLDLLACPVCKAPLSMKGDSALRCAQCKVIYPIQDGIPILLRDAASPDA